jgi:hypothetical protein
MPHERYPMGGMVQLAVSFERWAEQPRLQWTTGQDGPLKGRHASHTAMRGNCATDRRVPPTTTCSSSLGRARLLRERESGY